MNNHLRGHKIELLNNAWVYSDTKEPTIDNHKNRPCGKCNEYQTKEGHDPCLGTIEGAKNACCGHGDDNMAYIQFKVTGDTLKGKEALIIINHIKKTL